LEVGRWIEGLSGEVVGNVRCYVGKTAISEDSCSSCSSSSWRWSTYTPRADDAQATGEKAKELVAKAGREAYLNQEDLKKREVPDSGAWGIWRLVDGLRGYQAK
jgi:hypothetical protein